MCMIDAYTCGNVQVWRLWRLGAGGVAAATITAAATAVATAPTAAAATAAAAVAAAAAAAAAAVDGGAVAGSGNVRAKGTLKEEVLAIHQQEGASQGPKG